MKLVPLKNKIIISPELEVISKFAIPNSADKHIYSGKILSGDNELMELIKVKIGDIIIFNKFSYHLEIENKEYIILDKDHPLALYV